MARRALRVALSLVLTIVLVALFLWNVDLAEVVTTLGQAHLGEVVAAVALALFSYWLRALRWQVLLRPVGPVRHGSVVLATAVGYAAMTLLPARVGDIIRPLLLARRDARPASAALASVVTERLFDVATILAFFFAFFIWPPPMAGLGDEARGHLALIGRAGFALGAALGVAAVVLVALRRHRERLVELATAPMGRFSARWQDAAARFLAHFLDGLRVAERPFDLGLAVVGSIVLWLAIYWQVKLSLAAFAVDLPLRAAYLLVTLSVVGLALPTPAGVGGFHKAIQLGLTAFFAVGLERATTIAIAYHAICFVPITIVGLCCLPLLGTNLREVNALAAERSPSEEAS